MDPLPLEELPAGIPGEEDDDAELDRLAGCRVVEPVRLMGARDICFLEDALGPDHDVRQLEVESAPAFGQGVANAAGQETRETQRRGLTVLCPGQGTA